MFPVAKERHISHNSANWLSDRRITASTMSAHSLEADVTNVIFEICTFCGCFFSSHLYKASWAKPQPLCVSDCSPGTTELFFDRSFRLWQHQNDSGINLKARTQSKSGNSASRLIHHRCCGWCPCTCQGLWGDRGSGCVRWGISFLSAAERENALLTQRVASLLHTVYF